MFLHDSIYLFYRILKKKFKGVRLSCINEV